MKKGPLIFAAIFYACAFRLLDKQQYHNGMRIIGKKKNEERHVHTIEKFEEHVPSRWNQIKLTAQAVSKHMVIDSS